MAIGDEIVTEVTDDVTDVTTDVANNGILQGFSDWMGTLTSWEILALGIIAGVVACVLLKFVFRNLRWKKKGCKD